MLSMDVRIYKADPRTFVHVLGFTLQIQLSYINNRSVFKLIVWSTHDFFLHWSDQWEKLRLTLQCSTWCKQFLVCIMECAPQYIMMVTVVGIPPLVKNYNSVSWEWGCFKYPCQRVYIIVWQWHTCLSPFKTSIYYIYLVLCRHWI